MVRREAERLILESLENINDVLAEFPKERSPVE